MKHMKKIFALTLALIMVLGLATTASADTAVPGPFDVNITNATGHEYVIYQIFTGDLARNEVGKEILSNIKYGADYLPTNVPNVSTETLVSEEFLNQVKADPTIIVPTGGGTEMTTDGDTATATGLAAGYYMILDATAAGDMPSGEAASAVIFQVVGDTTIASKHPKTTIEKKVQDINDTTGEYTEDEDTWIDSADYDINDIVPFKSTANFDGLNNYDNYRVIFTDTMSQGLTYTPGSMKVSVNGVDKTDDFTIATANCNDNSGLYAGGTVITVSCNDIKPLLAQGATSAEIVLEYTATLNGNADLGAPGNPNKIVVSTNPDGSGETPPDVNIVFTYKVNPNKVNEIGEDLIGADFTLYKQVPAGTAGAHTGEEIKDDFADNVKADKLADDKYYVIAGVKSGNATGSTFGFNGVDDGTYVLVETQIPAGYNAWDAVEFVIYADHDVTADEPQLKTLTGGDLVTGEFKDTGIIVTDIENRPGVELPETGGIGTTIFYVLGGMMVLAAVVLLVTKKRMASAD